MDNKVWYIYLKYFSTLNENKILEFAGKTWIDLECIKLSKVTRSRKEKKRSVFPSSADLSE